ncbi:LppA family lipoprotein [Mycobacteroides abscessus]|uniref:LppA family lipoprotein n=1 Tax=Mycobacteroides abscessus TaxID=36809 RepID=UPI001F20229A|nr:LppA family lipoprotein [Mycobacteroides abscessus]
MKRKQLNRNAIGCITATVMLTLTGCNMDSSYTPTSSSDAAHALEELRALPSLEDTQRQLESALAEIKSAAESLIPSIQWQEFDKGSKGNCAKPYDQSDGQSIYLPDAVAVRTNISDEDWLAIQQATKKVAAKLGATESQMMQDKPGKHDIGFYGPAGTFIKLGYSGNLVISAYTGCRLPALKK